ncbi:MAG TPA: serpin family protein [Nocardioidaceae bacterium]|nr:serpin family protein [Nocardioidaceae bacterium]
MAYLRAVKRHPVGRSARVGTALTAALLLAVASACGTSAGPRATGPTHGRLLVSDAAVASPSADTSYQALTRGMRALGSELAQRLPSTDGNLVFSPASLSIDFAMLREGAAGSTATNLDSVLQLPANRRPAVNGLLHAMSYPGAGNLLQVSDGLFTAPGFAVRSSYLRAIKRWYDAGVQQVAFPQPALRVINSWVAERTHGRIPMLFQSFDPSTVAVLVNAIYLDAKWANPFLAPETTPRPFTTSAGDQVNVKTMRLTAKFDYASGRGWQAVRLPYRGDRLSMWVLLPRRSTKVPTAASTPGSLDHLLLPKTLAAVGAGFRLRPVAVSLPRWHTTSQLNLLGVLEHLGLRTGGDFSALSPTSGLSVSQVVQAANITVGEKGTVAAAATGIAVATSAQAPPPGLVRFDADHPFAYVIADNTTGAPLFEGTVGDPS